jgi:hypothetical protein
MENNLLSKIQKIGYNTEDLLNFHILYEVYKEKGYDKKSPPNFFSEANSILTYHYEDDYYAGSMFFDILKIVEN